MIDHITYPVSNIEKSRVFYTETLACLGYEKIMDFEMPEAIIIGYGKEEKPSFWIGEGKGELPEQGEEFKTGFIRGLHFAFLAPSVESIQAWYDKCLALGAKDNGKPGPRSEYHPGFYGAFVIDADGWKIEACLHDYAA